MDREILAAHLALVGGIAVQYRGYTLFIPGYRCHWVDTEFAIASTTSVHAITEDTINHPHWQEKIIHPRDIPDPHYDRVIALAIQEGAL